MSSVLLRVLAPALLLACFTSSLAQPLVRVPASTLRLPASPPRPDFTVASWSSVSRPVALVTAPGETQRMFVVEKTGVIRVFTDLAASRPASALFLDLRSRVVTSTNASDERGLLALAFHPDFARNRQFFVWYTLNATTSAGTGPHNRLSRFRVSTDNPNLADPASEEPLITQRDEAGNHNGGEILFGPDGYLYLSLGDEGGANDEYQNAQRIDRDFFAGILRIDVDRRPGSLPPTPHPAIHANTYAIPPDNPFVGATTFNGAAVNAAAVRTEFWATGLRNPWRMAFDSATGQLWCADVGQNAREEINLIVRGGNYGWPYREGRLRGPRTNPPAAAEFIEPIWDYPRTEGASIAGGFVYRGARFPSLFGKYLFADYVSGNIWSLEPDADRPVAPSRVQLVTRLSVGGISTLGLNPATGDILIAGHASSEVLRLAVSAFTGPPLPETLSATGAFANTATLTPAPGVVPYEPNVAFWADHATKRRWFALPDTTGTFRFNASPDRPWLMPPGAVWVKHFDLELVRGDPSSARRIETRVLVQGESSFYGISYRWNDAQTDATLVPDGGDIQDFTVVENGERRTQSWRFPSRSECFGCHTSASGHVLSFNTRQLNRTNAFPGGSANLLSALVSAGYLETTTPLVPSALPAHVSPDDRSQPLDLRARSYLEVNCAHCHQSGGPSPAAWDARASVSLAAIANSRVIDSDGDPANRVLAVGDPAHSLILQRLSAAPGRRMPPIDTNERDLAGESLLREWIVSLGAPLDPRTPARLANLAARAPVSASQPLITGFVIAPGAEKRVLIRAVGPTLASDPFRVSGALADPTLQLFERRGALFELGASNDNWDASIGHAFAATGAFSLPAGSRDAALLVTLHPGTYTAVVEGRANSSGIALVEIYDADPVAVTAAPAFSRLINTSVRAQVGAGADILIPGLVIAPGAARTILIRVIGPTLGVAPFNVPGALAQPTLTLFAGSRSVATNSGWNTAPEPDALRAAARAVGAFALPEQSRDSALLATLQPGSYTIQVAGANNTTGAALVEIYEVP